MLGSVKTTDRTRSRLTHCRQPGRISHLLTRISSVERHWATNQMCQRQTTSSLAHTRAFRRLISSRLRQHSGQPSTTPTVLTHGQTLASPMPATATASRPVSSTTPMWQCCSVAGQLLKGLLATIPLYSRAASIPRKHTTTRHTITLPTITIRTITLHTAMTHTTTI